MPHLKYITLLVRQIAFELYNYFLLTELRQFLFLLWRLVQVIIYTDPLPSFLFSTTFVIWLFRVVWILHLHTVFNRFTKIAYLYNIYTVLFTNWKKMNCWCQVIYKRRLTDTRTKPDHISRHRTRTGQQTLQTLAMLIATMYILQTASLLTEPMLQTYPIRNIPRGNRV